jgi:2-iminobutanoate/2-iminopropanoate deaminase
VTGKEKTMVERSLIKAREVAGHPIPSSAGAVAGNLVYTSGHVASGRSGEILNSTFREEVETTIENIRYVLEQAGTSLHNCMLVTCILTSYELFGEFNEIYLEHFSQPYPPRMTFVASLVHPDINVEMQAVAIIPDR